jgi:putative heme-binding domain-containing protein
LLRLADDGDGRVRLHVALALGETDDPRAITALAAIARSDGAQPWMRAAILSSVRTFSNDFLRAFVASPPSSPEARAAVMQDLGQLFGAGETPERCLDFIVEITHPDGEPASQAAALAGLAQGLRRRSPVRENISPFMALLSSDSAPAREAERRVEAILSGASAMALDDKAALEPRLAAIRLLGHTDDSTAGETLQRLLAPQHFSEIQVAAVRAMSQLPGRAATARLVEPRRWQAFTPQVREVVLSVLIADERHIPILLDALEGGSMAGTAIGPSRRSRLMGHRNAAIQARARALLAAVESGDRMQVYERLRGTVLRRAANAASGRKVFAIYCASCHAVDGSGGEVGPDLSGIRNQPGDAILLHALVPDYEITPGYQAYVVETRDGRTLVGRLESEAPNSVTLRDGASQRHVILRSDVTSMSASAHSLMPAELDRAMSEQDLADLIGYLKADPRPR